MCALLKCSEKAMVPENGICSSALRRLVSPGVYSIQVLCEETSVVHFLPCPSFLMRLLCLGVCFLQGL